MTGSVRLVASALACVSGAAAAHEQDDRLITITISEGRVAGAAGAGDYYLKLDGVGGEAMVITLRPVAVTSYSLSGARGAPLVQDGKLGAKTGTINTGGTRFGDGIAGTRLPRAGESARSDVTIKGSKIDENAAATPPDAGRVKVKMPWLDCKVGARFPRAELRGAGRTHQLRGLTVDECSPESVTFTYESVSQQ